MNATELRGGCLCGAVQYSGRSPWIRFVHCHCGRCRKATGSAHASNLFAPADALTWTLGGENVQRFDLPTAASFATCFCRTCGGPLPHLTRNGRAWVVPAGTLDECPDLAPQARIFWGSRAPWSCPDGGLSTFDGPPEG